MRATAILLITPCPAKLRHRCAPNSANPPPCAAYGGGPGWRGPPPNHPRPARRGGPRRAFAGPARRWREQSACARCGNAAGRVAEWAALLHMPCKGAAAFARARHDAAEPADSCRRCGVTMLDWALAARHTMPGSGRRRGPRGLGDARSNVGLPARLVCASWWRRGPGAAGAPFRPGFLASLARPCAATPAKVGRRGTEAPTLRVNPLASYNRAPSRPSSPAVMTRRCAPLLSGCGRARRPPAGGRSRLERPWVGARAWLCCARACARRRLTDRVAQHRL